MSSIGDTLLPLSTSAPLLANQTWSSQAFVLGQYNSMNIMILADQSGTFNIYWSGDNGLHFDAVDTYTVVANTVKRISVTSQQKTIQMTYVNGITDQTSFRLSTYGVVTNTNVTATLSGFAGTVGVTGTVEVSNLTETSDSSLQTAQLYPIKQYDFSSFPTSTYPLSINPRASLYHDLHMYAQNVTPTVSNSSSRSMITYYSNDDTGISYITGQGISARDGTALEIRFTGSWSTSSNSGGMQRLQGAGKLSMDTGNFLTDFMGFGYVQSGAATDTYDHFGIYVVYKTNYLFIRRTSWNVDQADGTHTLPILTINQLNGYRIVRSFNGSDFLNFYIANPDTGQYVLVHKMKVPALTDSAPSWCSSWTMCYYMKLTGTTPSDNPSMNLKSFGFYSQGPRIESAAPTYNFYHSGTTIGVDQNLIAGVATYNSGTAVPGTMCSINRICVTNSQGVDPLTVYVYNRGSITGGLFSNLNSNLYNVQISTTGTYSGGVLVDSFTVPPNGSVCHDVPPEVAKISFYYTLGILVQSNSTTDYYISTSITPN